MLLEEEKEVGVNNPEMRKGLSQVPVRQVRMRPSGRFLQRAFNPCVAVYLRCQYQVAVGPGTFRH